MSTLKDRMTEAMRRNPQVSQADLARACAVKPPSVADWLNGKTKTLKASTAHHAATLLGCDQTWLATGTGTPHWRTVAMPHIANEPAAAYSSLRPALRTVLAALSGLDDYTAAKVVGALQAAMKPEAPVPQIERDLFDWLTTTAPASQSGKRSTAG